MFGGPHESEGEREEESDDELRDDSHEEGAAPAEILPLALTAEGPSSDEESAPQPPPQVEAPSALPPPDFSDWTPGEVGLGSQSVTPQVVRLSGGAGTKRKAAAQISSGFKPALTRRDQIAKATEDELERTAEARAKNNGLSSAYDSVFHAPEGADPDLDERKSRTKISRSGKVTMMSKKEKAAEDALLASLRG